MESERQLKRMIRLHKDVGTFLCNMGLNRVGGCVCSKDSRRNFVFMMEEREEKHEPERRLSFNVPDTEMWHQHKSMSSSM